MAEQRETDGSKAIESSLKRDDPRTPPRPFLIVVSLRLPSGASIPYA